MIHFHMKLLVVVLAAMLLPFSSKAVWAAGDSPMSAAANRTGTVYVFRPMGGRLATREMDKIAKKLASSGLETHVLNYTNWFGAARSAVARYKNDPDAPIIVIGNSAGGDSALRFAHWLNRSRIPVDLIVTLDPTRIARDVPGNVERFINIHASGRALGGGDPQPARNFKGHFASVDLHDFAVLHRYLPEIRGLQDAVIAKVIAVAQKRSAPPQAASLPVRYPIPRGQPIVLWDSAMRIPAEAGDTAASVAAQFGVPAWAVAAMNDVDPERPLAPGQLVTVPLHLTAPSP